MRQQQQNKQHPQLFCARFLLVAVSALWPSRLLPFSSWKASMERFCGNHPYAIAPLRVYCIADWRREIRPWTFLCRPSGTGGTGTTFLLERRRLRLLLSWRRDMATVFGTLHTSTRRKWAVGRPELKNRKRKQNIESRGASFEQATLTPGVDCSKQLTVLN